ncbi:hypothetical protein FRC06_000688 [Ceratobasidium sp. 370]|nr:hypothetical protein FRC06_000688 [Ceratobasidium sp. 370]
MSTSTNAASMPDVNTPITAIQNGGSELPPHLQGVQRVILRVDGIRLAELRTLNENGPSELPPNIQGAQRVILLVDGIRPAELRMLDYFEWERFFADYAAPAGVEPAS